MAVTITPTPTLTYSFTPNPSHTPPCSPFGVFGNTGLIGAYGSAAPGVQIRASRFTLTEPATVLSVSLHQTDVLSDTQAILAVYSDLGGTIRNKLGEALRKNSPARIQQDPAAQTIQPLQLALRTRLLDAHERSPDRAARLRFFNENLVDSGLGQGVVPALFSGIDDFGVRPGIGQEFVPPITQQGPQQPALAQSRQPGHGRQTLDATAT